MLGGWVTSKRRFLLRIIFRAWQTFVADNFEFRLGVAIGAVVAQRWTEEADPFATPTLDTWKVVTDLPWFAFWAKELLRWGTLEPFVAFALSQGIARSRDDAANLKSEFIKWLNQQPDTVVTGEELIDPRNLLNWSRSRPTDGVVEAASRVFGVDLSGTDGSVGRYTVIPLRKNGGLSWIDPAGYELAVSPEQHSLEEIEIYSHDFDLIADGGAPAVAQFSDPLLPTRYLKTHPSPTPHLPLEPSAQRCLQWLPRPLHSNEPLHPSRFILRNSRSIASRSTPANLPPRTMVRPSTMTSRTSEALPRAKHQLQRHDCHDGVAGRRSRGRW